MSDPAIRIVSGTPTDEETAAIAAVVTQLQLERAASTMPLPEGAAGDAWLRSARGLRQPLASGGGWRNFG